ncbi:hypothetical protein H0H87_005962 [Tephrocybe sp. NHM501043]|nr:hypothetical protein H0H87_005962 [Tephrocybe sp. NHM501043]
MAETDTAGLRLLSLVTKVYSGKVSSMNQRSKTLEEVLKEIVQQKTGDPEALLSDDGGPDGICKTCV